MTITKIIVLSGMLFFSISFASAAVFYDMGDIITNDSTPTIPFRVVGTRPAYSADLFIADGTGQYFARGTKEVDNNTLANITCNITLVEGVYTYYFDAFDGLEMPQTSTSPTYDLIYDASYGVVIPPTPFTSTIELITDIPPTIRALKDIIIVACSIIILFVIVIGLKDSFEKILEYFRNIFKR